VNGVATTNEPSSQIIDIKRLERDANRFGAFVDVFRDELGNPKTFAFNDFVESFTTSQNNILNFSTEHADFVTNLLKESRAAAQANSLGRDGIDIAEPVAVNRIQADLFASQLNQAQNDLANLVKDLRAAYTVTINFWWFSRTITLEWRNDARYIQQVQLVRELSDRVSRSDAFADAGEAQQAELQRLELGYKNTRDEATGDVQQLRKDYDTLRDTINGQFTVLQALSGFALEVLKETRDGQAAESFVDSNSLLSELIVHIDEFEVLPEADVLPEDLTTSNFKFNSSAVVAGRVLGAEEDSQKTVELVAGGGNIQRDAVWQIVDGNGVELAKHIVGDPTKENLSTIAEQLAAQVNNQQNFSATPNNATIIIDNTNTPYKVQALVQKATSSSSVILDSDSTTHEYVTTVSGITAFDVQVGYDDVELLTLRLGGETDVVQVFDTLGQESASVLIETGGGEDIITATDRQSPGELAPENMIVDGIVGELEIDGGGDFDIINVIDTGINTPGSTTGRLTSERLTGLGMGFQGIEYRGVEDLNIDLGNEGDVFTIASTHLGTTDLRTFGGTDQVDIQTISGLTSVLAGDHADMINIANTNQQLNKIDTLLTVRGEGSDGDVLNVDDSGDTADNKGVLTNNRITGLGMGNPDQQFIEAAGGIDYMGFEQLNIALGEGDDQFTILSTHTRKTDIDLGPGDDTLLAEAIHGFTSVYGNTGDDTMTADELPSLTSFQAGVRDVLNFDGEGGTDAYIVNFVGASDYVINVLDTGAPDDGIDTLTLIGTPQGDTVLLRKTFVALLIDDPTIQNPTGNPFDFTERVNYNENINSRLSVITHAGDDFFYVDDNSSITTLDGGIGKDTFQIGQIFNSDRVSGPETGIVPGDEIDVIETTRGFLSPGVSAPLTAFGGDDEDTFTVYHNRAVIRLEGGDKNDEFTVRAFALPAGEASQQDTTEINAGLGTDTIQYAINAPVAIDGGDGFDTLIVLGSEFADDFVITKDAIFGAGLNVDFQGIEKVEVDGLEGDDNYYVLSTSENFVTTIFGSKGSDTFNVAGGVEGVEIVSDDLRGDTGIISHNASSDDPRFDGINIAPVVLKVAPQDKAGVKLDLIDGAVRVSEEGGSDVYEIVLTSAPIANVFITVSAGVAPLSNRELGGRTVQLKGPTSAEPASAVVLTFTPDNWNQVQQVQVEAIGGTQDTFAEGEQTVTISHSVISDDTGFSGLAIPDVDVRVIDDDAAGLIIIESDESTDVVESGTTDNYTLRLTKAPTAPVTVDLGTDAQLETLVDGVETNAIFFNDTNWNVPVTVEIKAVEDSDPEGQHTAKITHSVSSDDVKFAAIEDVEIDVHLQDQASVRITESGGETSVIAGTPGVTDDYQVVLNAKPTHDVTVNIIRDNSTITKVNGVETSTIVFTEANWNVPVTITVEAVEDNGPPSQDQPTIKFTSPLSGVNEIFGPLFIEGGSSGSGRELVEAVMLPNEMQPEIFEEADNPNLNVIEADQVDTLNVFNGRSPRHDLGTLTETRLTGLGMGGDRVIAGVPQPGGITYTGLEVVNIELGTGNDTFLVETTHTGATYIDGSKGTDTVNVQTIAGHTTIVGGLNDDTINVGSLAPETGGIVDGIGALLTVIGDAAADTLNIDDRAEEDDNDATLTETFLIGLDMVASPNADLVQTVTLNNAISGSFQLIVPGLPEESNMTDPIAFDASAEDVRQALQALLGQNEVVVVAGINVPVNVDNVAVEKVGNTFLIRYEGELRGLGADITKQLVADTSALNPEATIDVAIRTEGINYYGIETLNIDIGSGDDRFSVQGTSTLTNLNTAAGDDLVYVSSGSLAVGLDGLGPTDGDLAALHETILHNDRLDPVSGAVVRPGGTLDFVQGILNIEAGSDHNTLSVSDRNDTDPDSNVVITGSAITGLAPVEITYQATDGDFSGQGKWTGLADVGLFGRGINVYGGLGGNTIDIQSIHTSGPLSTPFGREITTVFAGEGSDFVTAEVADDPGRFLVLRGQGDDDVLDASATSLPVTVFGDEANDTIQGGTNKDHLLGDEGRIYYLLPSLEAGPAFDIVLGGEPVDDTAILGSDDEFLTADLIRTVIDLANDGNDNILGNESDDIILGGGNENALSGAKSTVLINGSNVETIHGGSGNDFIIGDYGQVGLTAGLGMIAAVTENTLGGSETILGGSGEDVLVGGVGDDRIDGESGRDLIFGDNVELDRRNSADFLNYINPRFQVLAGNQIYGEDPVVDDGEDLVNDSPGFINPTGVAVWNDWEIQFFDHDAETQNSGDADAADDLKKFGNDYIAGGSEDDMIFGQLGDDTIQGDGSINLLDTSGISYDAGAFRDASNQLILNPSFEGINDGDDYIEGNGGDDVIFGNTGQDDIIGGSSDLFSLINPEQ
jgi:hypothetical protein